MRLRELSRLDLTGWHYKILLALLGNELTTTDLAQYFERRPQNISKCVKELEYMHLIELSRIHGKNKFYKIRLD